MADINVALVEAIYCGKCNALFAACVNGFQDNEWEENKRDYLRRGDKVEEIPNDGVTITSCDCRKVNETLCLFEEAIHCSDKNCNETWDNDIPDCKCGWRELGKCKYFITL